jgi:hypothetical protein
MWYRIIIRGVIKLLMGGTPDIAEDESHLKKHKRSDMPKY